MPSSTQAFPAALASESDCKTIASGIAITGQKIPSFSTLVPPNQGQKTQALPKTSLCCDPRAGILIN